jgi:uncharacterized protein (DUF4415 family)
MTGKKPAIGSDLDKVDALPVTAEQYEDIPELTLQWFNHAELHVGGVKVRGRPKAAVRKMAIKLRLDPDVVQAFRKGGPGWQTKMNAALRRAAKRITRHKASAKPLTGAIRKVEGGLRVRRLKLRTAKTSSSRHRRKRA